MKAGFGFLPNNPRLNDTVAHTVSKASVVNSCGTKPIRERVCRYSVTISLPSTVIFPDVASIIPQIVLISVVLPAPFGPNKAKISAGFIDKLILLSALKPVA